MSTRYNGQRLTEALGPVVHDIFELRTYRHILKNLKPIKEHPRSLLIHLLGLWIAVVKYLAKKMYTTVFQIMDSTLR